MHSIGRFVLQCHIRTFGIVDTDRLANHFLGLLQILGLGRQKFCFQNSIDALSQCVLVAVVTIGHRTGDAVAIVNALVSGGTILGGFNRSSQH